eukprot:scaffold222883_cov33-Tisochrysis_lutea.AAC.2
MWATPTSSPTTPDSQTQLIIKASSKELTTKSRMSYKLACAATADLPMLLRLCESSVRVPLPPLVSISSSFLAHQGEDSRGLTRQCALLLSGEAGGWSGACIKSMS